MHEGLARAIEKIKTMPPQTYADIVDGLSVKSKSNGIPVLRLHYSADPERNPATPDGAAWYKKKRAQYDSDASGWDREYEIVDEAGGGERIFSDVLSRFKQVIIITNPEWKPNPHWGVVGGFDHGGTNPTVLEKCYVDHDKNLYFAGEFYRYKTKDWDNTIAKNAEEMLHMPDLGRMRWVKADPSIFWDTVPTNEGSYTATNAIYKQHGVDFLQTFEGEKNDLTGITRLLEQHWAKLDKRKPTLYIVCRNRSDKRQPGLHPYDCPNLLWELERIRRQQQTAKHALTHNATELIVDKDNHAWDALKYIMLTFPRAQEVPLEEQLKEIVKNLNPMSANIAATRFYNLQQKPQSKSVDIRGKAKHRPRW